MPGRYDVHFTDDPDTELGDSDRKTYRTLVAAAAKFATLNTPYKQLVYVSDCGEARWLNNREQRFVRDVAAKLGREVVDEPDPSLR
jgi:hypothetical protein